MYFIRFGGFLLCIIWTVNAMEANYPCSQPFRLDGINFDLQNLKTKGPFVSEFVQRADDGPLRAKWKVCDSLQHEPCAPDAHRGSHCEPGSASVCLVSESVNTILGPGYTHCAGKFTSSEKPIQFQTEQVKDSTNDASSKLVRVLHILVRDGDTCDYCEWRGHARLHTKISIYCNSSITEDPIIRPSNPVQLSKHGELVISIDHAAACGVDELAENLASKFIHSEHTTDLSIGSFMLIDLTFCVILYLSIGIAYNRVIKKKSGRKLVPNYKFWKNLPGLVIDGAVFAASVLPCVTYDPSKTGHNESKFHLLTETSEPSTYIDEENATQQE